MKNLYTRVAARLASQIPSLKWIRLFNNQFEEIEEGEAIPFNFPCAFVDFPEDITYSQLGAGQQQGSTILRIHIGQWFENGPAQDENTTILDLKDLVFIALQRYSADGFGPLIRVAERKTIKKKNLYIFEQDYSVTITDNQKRYPNPTSEVTGDVTLVIEKDLIIDDQVIRTGLEFSEES